MPPLEPREVATAKFLNALNEFMENPPRNLPDGTAENLKGISDSLKGYNEASASPGEREAAAVTGVTDGTGAPYSKAALNEDKPSPGQREYQKVMEKAKEVFNANAQANN
jgi:hypothetical protein